MSEAAKNNNKKMNFFFIMCFVSRPEKKPGFLHQTHILVFADGGRIYTDTCWSAGSMEQLLWSLNSPIPDSNPRPSDQMSSALPEENKCMTL